MPKEESLFQNEYYEFYFKGGEKNIYTFLTTSNIVYEIHFKPTQYLFGEDSDFSKTTFEFTIIVVDNPSIHTPKFDARTSKTIAAIFNNFFSNSPNNVIIYICDSSDNRQMIRKLKFDRWFEIFKGSEYIKIDYSLIDIDKIVYPISLIIKRTNPLAAKISSEFIEILSVYNEGK